VESGLGSVVNFTSVSVDALGSVFAVGRGGGGSGSAAGSGSASANASVKDQVFVWHAADDRVTWVYNGTITPWG
jgi:hypothetical protein